MDVGLGSTGNRRILVRKASVVSGEKCRKDTPGEARLYTTALVRLLVLDLTLATLSVKTSHAVAGIADRTASQHKRLLIVSKLHLQLFS